MASCNEEAGGSLGQQQACHVRNPVARPSAADSCIVRLVPFRAHVAAGASVRLGQTHRRAQGVYSGAIAVEL